MEHRVGVLLGVGHPEHRVDTRQDAVDPCGVAGFDRVEVGQVEDGHRGQRVRDPGWTHHELRPAQPVEQGRCLVGVCRGHPGERRRGRRPVDAHGTDIGARERIEQAGLADTRAAGQRQHVQVAGEPGSGAHGVPDISGGGGVDAEGGRRRDRRRRGGPRGQARRLTRPSEAPQPARAGCGRPPPVGRTGLARHRRGRAGAGSARHARGRSSPGPPLPRTGRSSASG